MTIGQNNEKCTTLRFSNQSSGNINLNNETTFAIEKSSMTTDFRGILNLDQKKHDKTVFGSATPTYKLETAVYFLFFYMDHFMFKSVLFQADSREPT